MSIPKSKVLQEKEAETASVGLSDVEMAEKALAATTVGKASTENTIRVPKVKCFGENIAILPLREGDVTEGGIVVPDESKRMPTVGVVLGAGNIAQKELAPDIIDIVGKTVKYKGGTNFKLDSSDIPELAEYVISLISYKNLACLLEERVEVKFIDA
jgi:co-chaperonin GroES (HSP10)